MSEWRKRTRRVFPGAVMVVGMAILAHSAERTQSPRGKDTFFKKQVATEPAPLPLPPGMTASSVTTVTDSGPPSQLPTPSDGTTFVVSIGKAGGNVVATWTGGPSNATYTVLGKTNALQASWTTMATTTNRLYAMAPTNRVRLLKVQAVTNPAGNGAFQWSKYQTGPVTADILNPFRVQTDSSGNVFVAGAFTGTLNFGGTSLTSIGDFDGFIAKYSSAGVLAWAKRFGGTAGDYAYGMTVDKDGNVLVSGTFSGSADFGGGNLVSAGGGDIFVAKYSPAGAHLWSKRFGGTGGDASYGVATDKDGNVVIMGWFGFGFAPGREVDFGGGPLASVGSYDVFLAKFNPSGSHLWSRRGGGTDIDRPKALAIDANADVLLGVEFNGTADFGTGSMVSAGAADVALCKFLGVSGSPVWTKRYGGPRADVIASIACDSNNVVLSGTFQDGIDFGGGVMTATGAGDFYLAKLTATGAHTWSKKFTSGATGRDGVFGIAVDSGGNVVMAGGMLSAMSLGGAALTNPYGYSGAVDTFVAKFNPAGVHVWSYRYGGFADDWAVGVAVDGSNAVYAAGQFYGSMGFGGAEQPNTGGFDGFLAKFAP